MYVIETMLHRLFPYSIIAVIDLSFLIGSYGVLRLLKISVDWVTWMVGGVLLVVSCVYCVSLLVSQQNVRGGALSNLFGVIAFLIAVHTANQWTSRKWYVFIKRMKSSALSGIVQGSKNILVFLRTYHQLLGWLVTVTACAHVVYFLPILTNVRQYEVLTGWVVLGILFVSVLLGIWIWIETAWRKRRAPKYAHLAHSALTIAFFLALLAHI